MYGYISEEKAMEKWCPFASSRSVSYINPETDCDVYAVMRLDDEKRPTLMCIGHHCMAWITERPVPENIQPGEAMPKGNCGMMVWRP